LKPAFTLAGDQTRGGRKGGLPIREATLTCVRTGLSMTLAGGEKTMPEKLVAVKLKQLSAQAATHPFAPFCVVSLGGLWW
jgi:hypothetical protein